ncbi:hypothetical protein EDC01DRAFT_781479 [Geopyxis carbonaria]|nr:hypothetical protein EDC01DRAFT_781479 [Geopyxis carbonaria]
MVPNFNEQPTNHLCNLEPITFSLSAAEREYSHKSECKTVVFSITDETTTPPCKMVNQHSKMTQKAYQMTEQDPKVPDAPVKKPPGPFSDTTYPPIIIDVADGRDKCITRYVKSTKRSRPVTIMPMPVVPKNPLADIGTHPNIPTGITKRKAKAEPESPGIVYHDVSRMSKRLKPNSRPIHEGLDRKIKNKENARQELYKDPATSLWRVGVPQANNDNIVAAAAGMQRHTRSADVQTDSFQAETLRRRRLPRLGDYGSLRH